MRTATAIVLTSLAIGLSACTSIAKSYETMGTMIFDGGTMAQADYEAMISAANAYPLGSAKNPVRVFQDRGESAYLDRLRCSDGTKPLIARIRPAGQGPFRTMMTEYKVDCGTVSPGTVAVFMDMHFKHHDENRPVPGFTITK